MLNLANMKVQNQPHCKNLDNLSDPKLSLPETSQLILKLNKDVHLPTLTKIHESYIIRSLRIDNLTGTGRKSPTDDTFGLGL